MDYEAYLRSPEWDRRRRDAIARAKGSCRGCKTRRRSLEVHHISYERLGAEWPQDLVVLCTDCHAKVHVIHKQGEISLEEATRSYLKRRREERRAMHQRNWGRNRGERAGTPSKSRRTR